ncbi:MAG: SpaA isopeptide-forming pilin-related protein, partial [Eubacteriales bacterium]|nr:SpaA isopeptide-forming pilin-related protein [Eubacteriales bacterium]
TTEPQTTEPQTTEAQATEPQAEQPEEESSEESEMESDTEVEEGVYTAAENGVSVSVKLPEYIELPEQAVLKVSAVQKDSEEYEKDTALAEKSAGGAWFEEYLVYDLHFEVSGYKISWEDLGVSPGQEDIEVTVTFEQPVFQERDFQKQEVRVYHIKDLTQAELEAARQEAQAALEEANLWQDSEESGEPQTEEMDEQKAVELKSGVRLAEDENGVSAILFKTDGFSDYVFGVTKTQAQMEAETESETPESTEESNGTESEKESESFGESESEKEPESESESESEPGIITGEKNMIPLADPAAADEQRTSLTLYLQQPAGVSPEGNYHVVIHLPKDADGKYDYIDDISVLNVVGSEITQGVSRDKTGGTVTIDATAGNASGDGVKIQLKNLIAGDYTVDAGGNYLKENGSTWELVGQSAYTTQYQINGANTAGTSGGEAYWQGTPASITISQPDAGDTTYDQNIKIRNVYTAVRLKIQDAAGNPVKGYKNNGGSYDLLYGGKQVSNVSVVPSEGQFEIKGLPLGEKYAWRMKEQPQGYRTPASKEISGIALELATSSQWREDAFTVSPTKVTVKAYDTDAKAFLANGKVTMELSGEGGTFTCKNGETITGQLSEGASYTLKQTSRVKGYVITDNNVSFKVDNKEEQTLQTVNSPTIVRVGSVLKSSNTYIAGATLEIRQGSQTVVPAFTSTAGAAEFKGKLDPGSYTLVQTKTADGYYTTAAETAFTVSDSNVVTSKGSKPASAVISNVTTKIKVYRKAFDTKKWMVNGEDKRYPLAGAVLQVQDMNGNVLDEWTTTQEAHVVERLKLGQEYKLVEIKTPDGYSPGGEGKFSTEVGGTIGGHTIKITSDGLITPSVTMQTARTQPGEITVYKRASLNGAAIKVNQTYYCALFTDSSLSESSRVGSAKPLAMTTNAVYATAVFENLAPDTYYVAETDSSGRVLSKDQGSYSYEVTIPEIHLTSGGSLMSQITNQYSQAPSGGYASVSPEELAQSYESQYANYGGSYEAAAQLASGTPVKTGDNTNWLLYVIIAAAALAVGAGALVFMRKKRK